MRRDRTGEPIDDDQHDDHDHDDTAPTTTREEAIATIRATLTRKPQHNP